MNLEEAMLKNRPDIFYNKERFEHGDINLCFITGLSGSGKSTLAKGLNAEVYELDDVFANQNFSFDNLKEYGDLIYSFFAGPGKKYKVEEQQMNEKWEKDVFNAFISYAKQYANSHKNTKFVIEGVELYWFGKPEDFKDYAVYIKGTSALKSMHRSAKRDASDASNKAEYLKAYASNMIRHDRAHAYADSDKTIQKWIDYYKGIDKMNGVSEADVWYDEDEIDLPIQHEKVDVTLNITGVYKHESSFDFEDDDVLDEADYSRVAKTSVVLIKIYPIVEKNMPSNWPKIKKVIGQFITTNSESLYAPAPYNIIPFTAKDYENFYTAFGVPRSALENIMKTCFFYNLNFNPRAAKNPFTAVMMMIIRYHLKKGNMKDAKLATIYTAFSGQFYPSIYSLFFMYPPKKEIMDYVVNNKLTDKYELRKIGTVFGAIEKYCDTWLTTYKKLLTSKDLDDDTYARVLVQQLHDRVKAFVKNISKMYYESQANEEYLNFDQDSLGEDEYHLASSNSTRAERYTANAVNYMTTKDVNYKFCGMVADQNVRKDEIKNIMSSIFHNTDNIEDLRKVCNIIIVDFMNNVPEKPVSGIEFINYAMTTKPNTKDKDLIWLRETIVRWLNTNSVDYTRRKTRASTASSYYKAVLKMIVLCINAANK